MSKKKEETAAEFVARKSEIAQKKMDQASMRTSVDLDVMALEIRENMPHLLLPMLAGPSDLDETERQRFAILTREAIMFAISIACDWENYERKEKPSAPGT